MAARKSQPSATSSSSKDPGWVTLAELERFAIQCALAMTNGSVSDAAKLLGIGRATLYRRPGLLRPQPPIRGKKAVAAGALLKAANSAAARAKDAKKLEGELRELCVQLGPKRARAIVDSVEKRLAKKR